MSIANYLLPSVISFVISPVISLVIWLLIRKVHERKMQAEKLIKVRDTQNLLLYARVSEQVLAQPGKYLTLEFFRAEMAAEYRRVPCNYHNMSQVTASVAQELRAHPDKYAALYATLSEDLLHYLLRPDTKGAK